MDQDVKKELRISFFKIRNPILDLEDRVVVFKTKIHYILFEILRWHWNLISSYYNGLLL